MHGADVGDCHLTKSPVTAAFPKHEDLICAVSSAMSLGQIGGYSDNMGQSSLLNMQTLMRDVEFATFRLEWLRAANINTDYSNSKTYK